MKALQLISLLVLLGTTALHARDSGDEESNAFDAYSSVHAAPRLDQDNGDGGDIDRSANPWNDQASDADDEEEAPEATGNVASGNNDDPTDLQWQDEDIVIPAVVPDAANEADLKDGESTVAPQSPAIAEDAEDAETRTVLEDLRRQGKSRSQHFLKRRGAIDLIPDAGMGAVPPGQSSRSREFLGGTRDFLKNISDQAAERAGAHPSNAELVIKHNAAKEVAKAAAKHQEVDDLATRVAAWEVDAHSKQDDDGVNGDL